MRTTTVWRGVLLLLACFHILTPVQAGQDGLYEPLPVPEYQNNDDSSNSGGGIARVITAGATLREEPSASAQRVLTLKKGDMLVLLDRNKFIVYDEFQQPKEGWFHAVHVRTGKDGWVRSKHLKVEFTSFKPSSLPLLQELAEDLYSNPRLNIANQASRTIYVRINGKTYTLKAHSSIELEVEEGVHRYHAWAPMVMPASGQDTLRRGYVYRWTFTIVRRFR